ncbi:MAG: BolA/IbaG family iron-sulfur metabolism protein [Francisellaceae bacterium]|nr:BolA/IbaG family iron-sulfur metabolism protein [Francisellaceae bacterium]MBT6206633.1 BolA/IbaG family iron-sulfur metabolism protein [Francisellaceae bacterium]MBT6539460.1 BolA/IbaG family iron-sulfur metabolism protein [Francisellaceae bacterium]
MNANEVESQIRVGLSDVTDILVKTEDEVHFYATVISNDFIDKTQVARQRQIYQILGEGISSGEIHAISFKTYTKKEWEEVNA